MGKLELRIMQTSLVVNDDDMYVEGLVNKTESWSCLLGIRKKFKEKISRGAFEKSLQKSQRIDFLAEHDATKLLATTDNDSLELWEDEEGLKMRAKICPTTYGNDIYQLMKHNIVNHMSFGFNVLSDKWKKLSNGTFERIVEELELVEVSVVRNPAYSQSAIAARGYELIEDEDVPIDIDIDNDERRSNLNNEQRAYASYLYSKSDVVNSAMNIVAECSSLSGYLMKYVGEDKDTASVLVSLQHAITMANKIINDEIQILIDDFNEYDAAIKDTKTQENEEERSLDENESKEVNEEDEKSEDEKSKDAETEDEKVDEKENDDESDETRSCDLGAYRKKIKERM